MNKPTTPSARVLPADAPTEGKLTLFGYSAFVLTSVVGLLVSLLTEHYSTPKLVLLIGISLIYIAIGTAVFERANATRRSWLIITYIAVQTLLGSAVVFLGNSDAIWLILMPLISHAVILLPFRWSLLFAVAVILIFAIVIMALGDWQSVFYGVLQIGVGVFFTFAFSLMLVRSEYERREVTRLAAELRGANQKLSEYATQVEELAITRERNRVAREIHDSLGHYLTVTTVQLEAARALVDVDPERAKEAVSKAQSLTRNGLSEVRRSVAALRASPLDNRTLVDAIRQLLQDSQASGLPCEFEVQGEAQPLGAQTDLTLFRVVQEGLTNIRKHSTATRVRLNLQYNEDEVCVTVCDNGPTHSAQDAQNAISSGFGLMGLRERLHLLNGDLEVCSDAQGFCLKAHVARLGTQQSQPYEPDQNTAGG